MPRSPRSGRRFHWLPRGVPRGGPAASGPVRRPRERERRHRMLGPDGQGPGPGLARRVPPGRAAIATPAAAKGVGARTASSLGLAGAAPEPSVWGAAPCQPCRVNNTWSERLQSLRLRDCATLFQQVLDATEAVSGTPSSAPGARTPSLRKTVLGSARPMLLNQVARFAECASYRLCAG